MRLIIEDDEGRKTVVPFQREEITIGRQEGNTIRLTERNVSRRHCKLVRNNGSIWVEDLGSYNGVRVNGDRIEGRQPIKPGDLIEVGDYDLAIEGDAQVVAPAPANGAAAPPATGIAAGPAAAAAAATAVNPVPLSMTPTPAAAGPRPAPKAETTAVIKSAERGAEDRPAQPVPEGQRPRLVALSTEHAGKEFHLDRTIVNIGKAPENEICVEHRSVSRNHCQIVREENGTWKVVDLQSANGVKVNGEAYAESPLKAGDTVQLGHLRFRFCAPGETFRFVPDADETVLRPVPKSGGSGKLIGIVLGVVVIGGAAAAYFTGMIPGVGPGATPGGEVVVKPPDQDPGKPDEPGKGGDTGKGGEQGLSGAGGKAALTVETPGKQEPAIAAGTRELDEAKQLLAQKKWGDAAKAAQAAVNAGAGDRAREVLDKAKTEVDAVEAMAAAQQALAKGNGEAALDALDRVGESSQVSKDAKKLRPKATTVYVKAKITEAKTLSKQKKYETALALLGEVEGRVAGKDAVLERTRADIEREQQRALKAAAPKTSPGPKTGPGPKPEPPAPGPAPAPSPDPPSDADLEAAKGPADEELSRRAEANKAMEQGNRLFLDGKCKQAIPFFVRALDLEPALAEAHKALGSCYAQLRDPEGGAAHYRKFLDMRPNHPQAPQIRKFLEDYETTKSKPK